MEVYPWTMNLDKTLLDVDLEELYRQEEFQIENRFNKVCLWFSFFFLVFAVLLSLITKSNLLDTNNASNIIGVSIFITYILLTRLLLIKGLYSDAQKYATVFFTISCITIIVAGYIQGVDYVHATRSVTLSAYFVAIIVSGLYQNPILPLFAAALAGIEYSILFFSAIISGFPIMWRIETFKENILTYDILVVNLVFYTTAGILVYLIVRRHRELMQERRDFIQQLADETRDKILIAEKATFFENFDDLTGLPNQKQFRDELAKHIDISKARNRVFAVMCLGLDAFVNVNQLYGMETGNAVLKEVAVRLERLYRDDDICCRFVGDSFLVLFADVKSSDSVTDLIKKTQGSFEVPFLVDDHHFKVSASGGIVIFPTDGSNPDQLIEKSESAMHIAKRAGKNVFRLFDRHRQKQLENRLQLEKELSGALDKNELSLVFQPKVDIEGKIVGSEALIRWFNPTLGSVKPGTFIPIAEKSHLIIPIGHYVFAESCRHAVKWAEKGIEPIRVTVNVSAAQFSQPDFTDSLQHVIELSGADPQWLGIEITETGIMRNESECVKKLETIKDMGLTVSIDDFGIGYSSLKRLGDYPLDTLKIDKSFVYDLPESETNATIVRTIAYLAHNLGYNIVAEGVENTQQIEFLKSIGCETFQGFYYYKPLSVFEFSNILSKNKKTCPEN